MASLLGVLEHNENFRRGNVGNGQMTEGVLAQVVEPFALPDGC